ncbi:xylulokinase [Treponema primitia]|uniref:xylulokinase n=1 Tax=Treponema primitia TaxID=88058 RepID=UPI000255520F|nr:FGGY-family carbohydrate kinase [Treponema primitia]
MSSLRTILCADIGTSSLKAALIDTDGHSHGFSREAYVAAGSTGPVTADHWERALARALGVLLAQADVCKPDAICVSGNGPTLVPLTKNGETLASLHWYQGPLGTTAPQKEGAPAIRSFFLPHALRFLREHPGDYEKTRYLFSAQEWLSWRLGADAVTALPASYGPYYWDAAQCGILGLDMGKFPPFVDLGTVIGRLAPEAVRRLSGLAGGFPEERLPMGIPIIAGGSDFIMALIGTGTVEPGMVCDRAGTSEGINFCAGNVVTNSAELRVLPHVNPGYRNISVIIPSSGRLFERYRTLSGQEQRPYEDTLAELIPEGRILDPAELGQAVLMAMGFEVRAAMDTLGRHGFPVSEMRLSGGQSKSRRWNQLKADLTGSALLVPEQRDGELAGDAVLGAIALGEAADLREGIGRIVHIQERYIPNTHTAAIYGQRFQNRRELRDRVGEALHEVL